MLKVLVLAFLFVFSSVCSVPFDTATLLDDTDDIDTDNYDIIVDQRQNGTQNFRIKISGLNIAIPDDREEPTSSPETSAFEQFAALLASSPQSGGLMNNNAGSVINNQPSNLGDFEDFADLAAYFNWKKSSKKRTDSTQSRTKDIPTESQLADDSKAKIKDLVKEERKRYKLLVGEKYIVPILRFLKKQTEDVKE